MALTAAQRIAARTVTRILGFPDTWDQTMWMRRGGHGTYDASAIIGGDCSPSRWEDCGTTACAAGHIVAAAVELGAPEVEQAARPTCLIDDTAGRLLRLTARQQEWLFDAGRSRDEVVSALSAVVVDGHMDRVSDA
ncbi:MAG: hypothetical protein OXT70_01235 [Chloroflexota bacterium]|nr:hypothetical protein [Chloroflexota bacterium]